MLTYHTAGESHGKGLLALIDGFPAGLEIQPEIINYELKRRQGGYGRGGRQKLETDVAEILTGVWGMTTIGSPIALWVKNRDYRLPDLPDLETPRPGHGDLSGSRKYLSGMRAILERASARETAARVAAGGLARQLLAQVGISGLIALLSAGAKKSRHADEKHHACQDPDRYFFIRKAPVHLTFCLRSSSRRTLQRRRGSRSGPSRCGLRQQVP